MARYGMLLDLTKCCGCYTCVVMCKMENGTRPNVAWSRVRTVEWGDYPEARQAFVPSQCAHCDKPACVEVCPTGASFKRNDGLVLIDYDKCIGCRACEWACPYGSRVFNGEETTYFPGVVTPYEEDGYAKHRLKVEEKCTFCAHRLAKGRPPACVAACPAGARLFGDLEAADSELVKTIKATGAVRLDETGLYYVLPAGASREILPKAATGQPGTVRVRPYLEDRGALVGWDDETKQVLVITPNDRRLRLRPAKNVNGITFARPQDLDACLKGQ